MNVINPVFYARTGAGLSKSALAKKLGVSRTFIIRTEQGCYERVTSKLSIFTCRELNISREELGRRYARYQYNKRVGEVEYRSPELLGKDIYFPPVATVSSARTEIYPHEVFKQWRQSYWGSIVDFAGNMCVHPGSVNVYEDGRVNSMPQQLRESLESMKLIQPGFDVNVRWFYGTYREL